MFRVRNREPWPFREFSEYLTAARDAAGIRNDRELGERADIYPSLISRWRSGEQRPSRVKLRGVSEALGVPLVNLEIMAGLATAAELGLDAAPDVRIIPAEVRDLLDVLADDRVTEGERKLALSHVSVIAAGMRARLDAEGEEGSRPAVRRARAPRKTA